MQTNENLNLAAIRLFGYSFLILFFELALIRFIPATVQIASFFINLVLVATFLGMGTGLILQQRNWNLSKWFAPALLLLLVICYYFANIIVEQSSGQGEFLWSIKVNQPAEVQTFGIVPVISIIFITSTFLFIPLGVELGRNFAKFSSLVSYSINIFGSLIGLIFFGALSYFSTPPVLWFALGFGFLILIQGWKNHLFITLLCIPLTLFMIHNLSSKNEIWSQYYKINYFQENGLTTLIVNGSLHQHIINLSDQQSESASYSKAVKEDYLRPYNLVNSMENVLILGSGTGNDVAIALLSNPGHVDAVEIDNKILELGRDLHYQKPYSDPRVTAYNDDARAFLKKSTDKYDLIVLGTLDSQTLLSGMSSVRLDNYVYTLESFQSIKDHLKENGVVIIYHMSPNPGISYKIYALLKKAFGVSPLMENLRPHKLFNYIFVAGSPKTDHKAFNYSFNLSAEEEERIAKEFPSPTDDWPYLYLSAPEVPGFYLKLGGVIVAFSLILVALALGKQGWGRPDGTLFFLGAGFMLLETKSVTEMSLLFGSTWMVNMLVFTSVLSIILVANAFVIKTRSINIGTMFILLFASIILSYFFPVKTLFDLPLFQQWLLGGTLVALPILFSSIVFATLFKDRTKPVLSLGYNIIGAILGGLLEYSSMAGGTKSLYLIAILMYLLAFLIHIRRPAI